MKKLKIFLLLSILLCFGFALNSEIHAQGGGPKAFEIGDVLPQGLVKITGQFYIDGEIFIRLNSVYFIEKSEHADDFAFGNSFDSFLVEDNTDYSTGTINAIFDFSSLSESERTFNTGYYDGKNKVYWEEYIPGYSVTFEENGGTSVTDLSGQIALPNPLPIPSKENHTFLGWYYNSAFTQIANPGDIIESDVTLYAKWELNAYKPFEVGDVLPQGIIRVSWDEPNWFYMGELIGGDSGGAQIKSSNNSFNFIDRIDNNYFIGGINIMFIPAPGYLQFYPPYTVYGEGHAYVDINTVEWDLAKRTISTVFWGERLTSRLYWEDITPDGYTQGYLEALEEYGYNDPITDQWLSVEEYLDLYGTDKPGQSDFYANFDKYFIPAMIIVFGGAIVLTILKVFKGRE